MTLDTDAEGRVRRAPNLTAQAIRRARQLVAPFQERIGPWQKQLAHLRTTKMFRSDHEVNKAAAELLPLVIGARIEFEAAVAECVDEAVAQHNVVASVGAALERLRDELEDLQLSD